MNKQPNNRLSQHSEQGGAGAPQSPASTLERFAGLLAQTAAKHAMSDPFPEAEEGASQPSGDVCGSQTA